MICRLKSLELHGYKTFASRTAFEFPGDITAIVGPNGSGKSNIADALRRDGYPVIVQLEGLLHDGGEFIDQDMTRPRKNALRARFPEAAAFLQANEERNARLIAEKFDLPWPFDPVVDEYDGRIVNDEKAFIFGPGKPWSHGGEPLNVDIQCWEPAVARRQMKLTFYKLWRELGRLVDEGDVGA